MVHYFLGLLTVILFTRIKKWAKQCTPPLRPLHWILITLLSAYLFFIVEVIIVFIQEGSLRGAIVNGCLLGVPAAIMSVLFVRLVLHPRNPHSIKSSGVPC